MLYFHLHSVQFSLIFPLYLWISQKCVLQFTNGWRLTCYLLLISSLITLLLENMYSAIVGSQMPFVGREWFFTTSISLLSFCLGAPSITERGLKSPTIIVDLSISPFSSFGLCFQHFASLLFGAHTFKIIISSQ